jgi:hypothetical protein
MMRGVLDRSILTLAAVAIATIGLPPLAHAEPECPSGQCAHVSRNSPSYKDGYKTEHDYFSIPQNHAYLASEMKNGGYTTATACQAELGGGAPPPSPTDWISGCVDALHDLGFKP